MSRYLLDHPFPLFALVTVGITLVVISLVGSVQIHYQDVRTTNSILIASAGNCQELNIVFTNAMEFESGFDNGGQSDIMINLQHDAIQRLGCQ